MVNDKFIMVPNFIDELGLSVNAVRLYLHLKHLAGEDGKCWQSQKRLAEVCGMHKQTVVRCKRELESAELIKLTLEKINQHYGHVISIVDVWDRNTKFYQEKGCSTKGIPQPKRDIASGTKGIPQVGENRPPIKNPLLKTPEEDIYTSIFNFWNDLKIISHRRLKDDIRRALATALKDYSKEELCTAMGNYAEIVKGPEYFYTYKRTLKDFLKEDIEKFLDGEVARQNYRKGNAGQESDLPDRGRTPWNMPVTAVCRTNECYCNKMTEHPSMLCPEHWRREQEAKEATAALYENHYVSKGELCKTDYCENRTLHESGLCEEHRGEEASKVGIS